MVDEFGMGAFSMIVVEDMSMKDAAALEKKIEAIDHVEDVLWYDDALDISVPTKMMPDKLRKAFFNGDATMMIALFDNTTSADDTMDAIANIRKTVGKSAFAAGMSGVVTDIKDLALKEMPVYVMIAAALVLVVLLITMESFVTPLIFLATIGMSIVYNLGSNFMLGEISYITQALAAVLQLAVTMDYSIFLLESYEANKERFPDDNKRAMKHGDHEYLRIRIEQLPDNDRRIPGTLLHDLPSWYEYRNRYVKGCYHRCDRLCNCSSGIDPHF